MSPDYWFGKYIILMNDTAQLPATEEYIFDTFLWKRFDIVMLKDVKWKMTRIFKASFLQCARVGLSGVPSGYARYSVNTLGYQKK